MLPNLYDLKYFLEVAKTLNISRASERLGVSQPSLSTAIKRLEDSLGSTLLIRSKTGVQLSHEGKLFQCRAHELLREWEDLQSTINRSSEEPSGRFVLGAHPAVALYTTPHFLENLLEKFPQLELQFVHGLSRKIVERIISFEVDIGLVVNPVHHPDLVLNEIGADEVTFWISQKCPEKNKDRLFFDPQMTQSQSILKNSKKKFAFKRFMESSSLEWISLCAREGLGVGVLPGRVARREGNVLKKLSPDAPVYCDKLYLVYRADHLKSPAAKKILRSMTEDLKKSFR